MNQPNDFDEAMKKFKKARMQGEEAGKKFGKFFPILFLVIGLVWGAISCYYTVQPDEEAVVIRLGKYIETNQPGLHFKIPFGIDRVHVLRTKAVHQLEFGFRSTSTQGRRTDYTKDSLEEESLMLTGDLNVADVEWVVQYQISDPYKFMFKLKNPKNNPNQNIRDVSESIMRRVVGDRQVGVILTVGRAEIASEAKRLMQELFDKYDIGIRIVTVELQDVNPPEEVKESFNDVNSAKQEQEKMINEAEKKYNEIIPEARGKAEELVSRAEGFAEGLIARSKGNAGRFELYLEEYQKAPQVTKKRLYIETMEELFINFQDLTIIDSKVQGVLPIHSEKAAKQ
jgi:membrane protease subunit HflK